MAICPVNRSFYVRALLGVALASAINASAADFSVGSDFLRAIPRSSGALTGIDPTQTADAHEEATSQQPRPQTPVSKAQPQSNEEDAILAEAERLMHNELLDSKATLPRPSQPSPGTASATKINTGDELIRLSAADGHLHIQPATLELSLAGSEAAISLEGGLQATPQVFVRDSSKIAWDGKRFHGMAQGKTEIYFVYQNEMYILPVSVGETASKDLLTDLGAGRLNALKLPGGLAQMPEGGDAGRGTGDLSIAEASMQAKKTKANEEAQQNRFVYNNNTPGYRDTAIQVMDTRSSPKDGKIFPMAGVTVQLMGLNLQAKTDATGIARFADLPAGSRLWAVVADQEGRVVPTANEIVIPRKGKAQVQRVRTMSYTNYVNYMEVWGVSQNWANGSVCARALDATGKEALEGLAVQINDEHADGPFYFSDHGPQPGQKETGLDGRFCFFNVKPGLAEITFFRSSQLFTALTMPVFPGAHSEEELPLETGRAKSLYLASMSGAMDQLVGDDKAANTLEGIVTANVISIGENTPMAATSENVLSHQAQRSEFKGRTYSLVQTAEFENTLEATDVDNDTASKQMPVMPLLPRGFVEDIFSELNQSGDHASIAFDPAMGQLVVMHKLATNEDPSKLNIVVMDAYGRAVDQGWYFGSPSQGLLKAVFFNLQPGLYSVKVQHQDGSLSALDTVAIDYWTTGLVQTGGSLQYDLSTPAPEMAASDIDANHG